jgi:glycosyltransferase involved in cell wall biosynthesis
VRVLALIPACDEAGTIGAVVEGVRAAGLDALVVDDGSRDATAARAAAAGAIVLRHERNRGKGAALRTGFAHARRAGYDAVLTLDADLQHDPREAARFLDAAERTGADLVCGSRAASWQRMPLLRRATNAAMSLLVSLLAGVRLRDTQCGYRLLGRRALERIEVGRDRFEVDSEIVLRAAEEGLVFAEVPVSTIYLPGRASRIRFARDTLRFLALVLSHVLFSTRRSRRVTEKVDR